MKAFHFDFNTAFFRMDYLERFIRKLREYGYDTLLWELEDFVRWDSVPHASQCDSISKAKLRKLLDSACELGFENIPLLQCLGHCEYVLHHPEYAHLADAPGMLSPYCPSNGKVLEFLAAWLKEYMALFADSRYIHLGCDEVWQLGEKCPACQQRIAQSGKGALMAEHINFLSKIVLQQDKTPVIWADMLLIHPEMAGILNKNTVTADWRYELRYDREKLWLWDDKGGYLTDGSGITETIRHDFGKYLYVNDKLNIHYTTDFLRDRGFKVICAGASSCYPDNFLLGNASNHIFNSCTMMRKGMENLGYLHTSWTVHLFFYELQPAIELASSSGDCRKLMDDYTQTHFGIGGEEFFAALDMLSARVLFSGAESTGCGKAVKEPAPGIIRRRLEEYQNFGILLPQLDTTIRSLPLFEAAWAKLLDLQTRITRGGELFSLYILAARTLVNRARFGILAASEFLGMPHNIDRLAVKEELMLLKESYLPEYMKRQTDEHARRMVRIIFDPLLDCL